MEFLINKWLLVSVLSLSVTSIIFGEDTTQYYFLEDVKVNERFQFYKIVGLDEKDTVYERSVEFRPSKIDETITEAFIEEEYFEESVIEHDATRYINVTLNELCFVQNFTDLNGKLKMHVKGDFFITDNLGNQLFRASEKTFIIKGKFYKRLIYATTVERLELVNEEFYERVTDGIIEIIKALDQEELSSDKASIPEVLTISNTVLVEDYLEDTMTIDTVTDSLATIEAVKTVWDPYYNSSVLKVLNPNREYSGAIISNSGYFICDYKAIRNRDACKVVTAEGDTLTANVIRFNKDLEVAICKVAPLNYTPFFAEDNEVAVGKTVYFRGFTDLRELPMIVGQGKLNGRVETKFGNSYLFAAVNATSMSGAPVINAEGERIGVLISRRYTNKNRRELFAFYPNELINTIFKIQYAN